MATYARSDEIKPAGKRLLVVEDEFMIATRIADILEDAGYEVVGPILNAAEAAHAITVDCVDGALLDLNLRGDASLRMAEAIARGGVPVLFVTGYAREILTGKWKNAPHLGKPFTDGELLDAVARMLAPVRAA